MRTVADIPSGPANRAPTSPDPPCIDHPSGTATVRTGAAGSPTLATRPIVGRCSGPQVTAPAGAGALPVVGSTPKSGCCDALPAGPPGWLASAVPVAAPAATGVPSL